MLDKLFKLLFGSSLIDQEQDRRSRHEEGKDCDKCCPTITDNGTLVHSVRSVLFYCDYDIPARAGQLRHKELFAHTSLNREATNVR